jgi:hypothetical protein
MTAEATARAPDTPPIIGYVEAATGSQVVGWAWAPAQPQARLLIQVLLDDAVLVEAAADRGRDDLARNGIGDGRHAFELAVPDAVRSRLADLRVVARDAAGQSVRLGAPPPPEAAAERLDRLQRGVDTLIASQRLMHRNLQAALLAVRAEAEVPAHPPDLAAAQADVARQLGTLEVFAMRLDERLAALAAPAAHPPPRVARAAWLALGLGGVALALSVWGLLRSLPG